jgi:two-component system, response regulator PdtaR
MEKPNILIVEDEYITALDIKTRLIIKGHYNFEIVASGEDAVKRATADHFDLILMDIKLSGKMDGIEAVEQIRKKSNACIVYISGNSDLLNSKRLKDTKPEGALSKPINDWEIYKIIEMVAKKKN